MKRVLVFGGFGFLGYYLVKELIKRSYIVSVADINDNEELSREVKHLKCDIRKKIEIESIFKQDQYDIVYNLAGLANLEAAVEAPVYAFELNVISNMYIIEACIKYHVSKFVYASSAYAVSNKGSFYGISKLASEKLIEEYHNKHNLNFTILRYGSVYSERSYDNNYIYNLVKEAVTTKRINHKGDGTEIREYIHAADAAKLSVDVIETNEFDNLHVILTGTERMQRIELFNMIKEILDNRIDIYCHNNGYQNHYKFTPYSFAPSMSKKLVANPHIDIGQGLLECVKTIYNKK